MAEASVNWQSGDAVGRRSGEWQMSGDALVVVQRIGDVSAMFRALKTSTLTSLWRFPGEESLTST